MRKDTDHQKYRNSRQKGLSGWSLCRVAIDHIASPALVTACQQNALPILGGTRGRQLMERQPEEQRT